MGQFAFIFLSGRRGGANASRSAREVPVPQSIPGTVLSGHASQPAAARVAACLPGLRHAAGWQELAGEDGLGTASHWSPHSSSSDPCHNPLWGVSSLLTYRLAPASRQTQQYRSTAGWETVSQRGLSGVKRELSSTG